MATAAEALATHGHLTSDDPKFVFGSKLARVADRIRSSYKECYFDHRPLLPERDRRFPFLLTEEFRRGYACFKWAVSYAIQPASICEVGVGAGTGAHAFLDAYPKAHYIGIDDGSKGREDGYDFLEFVRQSLSAKGYSWEITIQDSQKLEQLPRVNLIHVDGCHEFRGAYHDVLLAMLSGSEWILVDDARDFAVAAGTLMALHENYRAIGNFEWMAFDDTWTGNILIRRVL